MKKFILIFSIFIAINGFAIDPNDIFRGADSGPVRRTNGILLKASPLDSNVQALDVILETGGKSAAIKAQNFVKDHPIDPISTWMLLVLADYYAVEGKVNTAANLLNKARIRDEVVAEDAYFRMIEGRLKGSLISSPGLKSSERNSTLVLDLAQAEAIAEEKGLLRGIEPELPAVPLLDPAPGPAPQPRAAVGEYHLQVGAFSEESNTRRIAGLFRDNGYDVQVRQKQSGDRLVFLVWVGNFQSRQAALDESERIESSMSVKSFVVKNP